jgi:hypothetical protein
MRGLVLSDELTCKYQLSLPVDFGNGDPDGAVRLITRETLTAIKAHSLELHKGMKLTLTDGELKAEGFSELRDDIWVVVVTRWLS